jgi:hypothetical protein
LRELEEICKRLLEFEETGSQGKAVEVTVNSKEENSLNFCLGFRIRPLGSIPTLLTQWNLRVADEVLNKVRENQAALALNKEKV